MKLCNRQGNGVCLNCQNRFALLGYNGVCRYRAEELLDCLQAIIDTEWTREQEEIFAIFEITKQNDYEVRE